MLYILQEYNAWAAGAECSKFLHSVFAGWTDWEVVNCMSEFTKFYLGVRGVVVSIP